MRTSIVLTLIGRDRPGIVEAVASRAGDLGANWEQSRLARLAGRFAGVLRLGIDASKVDALEASLKELEVDGLRIVVDKSVEDEEEIPERSVRFELVGNDRPGIIRDVSRALNAAGATLDELESRIESAPMAGGLIFRTTIALRAPPERLATLPSSLERLANELMVDITVDDDE